jgi:hypothetical protein
MFRSPNIGERSPNIGEKSPNTDVKTAEKVQDPRFASEISDHLNPDHGCADNTNDVIKGMFKYVYM